MLFTSESRFDAEAAFLARLDHPTTPASWRSAVGRALSPLHTWIEKVEDDDAVVACVQHLVDQGMDAADVRDEDNVTLLHRAAQFDRDRLLPVLTGSLRGMEGFLDMPSGTWAQSPLIFAAMHGSSRSVIALIALGANVTAVDTFKATALMHLVKTGDPDGVRALIEAKSPVNAKDQQGNTALHRAAQSGHAAVVQMLLDAGAKADALNKAHESPLQLAQAHGYPEVVGKIRQTLVDREAQALRRAMRAKTPVVLESAPSRQRL